MLCVSAADGSSPQALGATQTFSSLSIEPFPDLQSWLRQHTRLVSARLMLAATLSGQRRAVQAVTV